MFRYPAPRPTPYNLESGQPTKGKPEIGIYSQVPGLGRQVPGSGVRHQGQVQGPHPFLNDPATCHPGLPPATRNDSVTQGETGNRDLCCDHIPQLTIRSPSPAPFEFYLGSGPPGLSCAPLVHVSPCPRVPTGSSRRLRAGMSPPNPPPTVTIFYLCLKNRPHAPCARAAEMSV
jgi:hypothetical protein